jgi:predicted unusual protein kinase regulating ubiquinone biosynthesis (AarF/ABC1/UbiB family)
MEEVQIASNSKNEREGRDVNLGVKGSNSNGHGRELDKEGNMMKIIEILQKDAQAHRADSQNLMRVKDQQGEFNLKMLKSLERIERKLEKESDTRKTGSRRTPERKRRLRSGSRHRRRSPKHSGKEAHSSSSPSPTRKH